MAADRLGPSPPPRRRWARDLVVPVVLAVLAAGGLPWWWPLLFGDGISRLDGGCTVFQAVAQNRLIPYGATVRAQPDDQAAGVDFFEGNANVYLDGWAHGMTPYPDNPPPYDSDVWFHVSKDAGWVSQSALRSERTTPDSTSQSPDRGALVEATAGCEGAVRQSRF